MQNAVENRWCVYIHTNKINNKVYIGITSRHPKDRWGVNGSGYSMKRQPVFRRAIDKYKWDNFEHIIFAENLSEQDAKHTEVLLIAMYKSNCCRYNNPSFGYNMTDGGDGSRGYVMSEDARQRMSEAKAGIKFTEEHKRRIAESHKGKIVSDETRRKLSNSKLGKFTGKNNPNYGNHKLAGENNPMYGKQHSQESKDKMSAALIGKFAGERNYFYGKRLVGISNPRYTPVYCIELDEIFWGAKEVENKYDIAHQSIPKCCKGKKKSAGKHPETQEPLHWLYVDDYIQEDGTAINGAITLGYITQQMVDEYLSNLKEKENDT